MSDEVVTDLPELSERVRRFVNAYAGEAAGNGVRACELAGYEGDRDVLATQAWRLLRKAEVRSALDAMLESDPLVAGRIRRLRFLTRVMDGVEKEVRITGRDDEGKLVLEESPPSIKDRLAAAEALAKLAGDYITKVAPVNSQGEDLKGKTMAELLELAQMKVG